MVVVALGTRKLYDGVHFVPGGWGMPSSSGQRTPEWLDRLSKPRGTELLRVWAALRRGSIVFVYANPIFPAISLESGKGFLEAMRAGLSHERAEVRSAAAHALRHCPGMFAVESALKVRDDREPAVTAAARDSLRRLTGRGDGTAESLRAWWEEKGTLLEREDDPCICGDEKK